MGKYKKCPRCELNWIPSEEELCEVCKAELGKASKICLIEDEDEILEERICPICKVNYLAEDEDICPTCRAEQADKPVEKVEEDNWEEFVEDDEPVVPDDDTEVSLSLLQEEEDEDDEDEDRSVDDFDDDDIPVDLDFDDEDDEEEDEEDDEALDLEK